MKGVSLIGGPMDGQIVAANAPALLPEWWRSWPCWQGWNYPLEGQRDPGRYVMDPTAEYATAVWELLPDAVLPIRRVGMLAAIRRLKRPALVAGLIALVILVLTQAQATGALLGLSIGDVFLRLLADDKGFASDVERKAGAAADKAGGRAGQTLGERMNQGASRALTAGGAAIGTFVAAGVEKFAGFQERMNEVFTLLPGITEEAMGQMSDDVKSFSRETGRTTEEVVPALYQALSSGVPPDNVFEFLRTANKAAVAGAASTTDSVNLLSAVTKAYGDTSDAAVKKTADLAFETVKLGQTTYPELAASIGKVTPLAAALGVAEEELFGITATLTGVTGNTAEQFTQQKAIMTALIKTNPLMTKTLKEMGFESGEAAVKSLGLKGTLVALSEATGGNTKTMADMLGSTEALTATLALTGAQAETATEKIEKMGNVTGGVDEAFEVMDSGIAATGRKIAATVGTIALDVGEKFQAIGPMLLALNQGGMLFGISPARMFGGIAGAVTGKVIPGILGAFKGLGVKLAGTLASSGTVNAMGEGLGSALGKVGSSGPVKAATGALGKMMGSSIGRAMGLGFAAVAVAVLAAELIKVNSALNDQMQGMLKQNREFVEVATREQIEAARKKAAEELAGLQGFDLTETLFGSAARQQARATLEDMIADMDAKLGELPDVAADRIEQTTDAIQGGLTGAQADIARAAGYGFSGVAEAAEATVAGATQAGRDVPEGFAQGVISRQGLVTDAMSSLRNLMQNSLGRAQRIARTIGQLTSKELADGLTDRRAAVRQEARRVQAVAEQELAGLIARGGKVGKKAMDELNAGLKSKNPEVRRSARRVKEIVDGTLETIPPKAKTYGAKTGESYATGLRSMRVVVKGAAIYLVEGAKEVLRAFSPPGPESPLHDIGKWAKATGDEYADHLPDAAPNVRAAARRLVAGAAAEFGGGTLRLNPTMGAVPAVRLPVEASAAGFAGLDSAVAAGSTGGDTYNIPVHVTGVLAARTPDDVARPLRQLASAGVISSKKRRQMVKVPSRG